MTHRFSGRTHGNENSVDVLVYLKFFLCHKGSDHLETLASKMEMLFYKIQRKQQ